ncbi:MAG: DUF4058 family protein [Anaerolineae bacterium]
MPSPFPGMDPYLERPTLWPDVHFNLIHAIQASLVPQVAPHYYVAVEERTYVVAVEADTFVGRPDVAVVGPTHAPSVAPAGTVREAVLERPVTVELPLYDRVRQRYLEVRDGATHEVITVIEVLSPSNKQPGEDRQRYERKRRQVLEGLTNLVEMDLLRAWEPMPMDPAPSSHYRMLVSRGWERPKAELYPFYLEEPIPEIPIPLREGETEPTLALGELLAQIYDQVRYDLRIDYTSEPDPALDPTAAAWAHDLLQQAGRW